MTQLSKINFNKLYEDVEKVIPVSEQYINGVWLVDSFADPETTVTANSDVKYLGIKPRSLSLQIL